MTPPVPPVRRRHDCRPWLVRAMWLFTGLLLICGPAPPAAARPHALTNPLGMTFVLIPAGMFMMGSPVTEAGRDASETRHQVTISRPFYMQTTEVTIDQWRAVMGRRFIARKKGAGDMPVVRVSWQDCQTFIGKLNRMTGERYALPTEAQWEYAARAGTTTAFFWGERIDCSRAMYANNPMKYDACVGASRAKGLAPGCRAPVMGYPPNAWGLYDMPGNVWEWCEDYYHAYSTVSQVDPLNDATGQYRVRRGGSWFGPGHACRSANRAYGHAMSRMQNTGFRLVLPAADSPARPDPLEEKPAPGRSRGPASTPTGYEHR